MPAGRDAAVEPPTELEPLAEPDGAMPPGLAEPEAALPVVPVAELPLEPVDGDVLPLTPADDWFLMLLVARSQHCVDDPDAPGDDGEGVVLVWA